MVFTVESPLGPGASLTFNGTLAFFYDGGIPSFETWAVADDCSPTPAPDTCRVIEGNEANNQTGPQRVEVINTPPSAAITSPDGDLTLAPDGYGEGGWYKDLVLIGSAQDPEQGPLDGDSLTWTSDLAGNLGSGSQLPARLYSNRCTGQTHIVTLTASDSQNAQATDTRRITIKNEVCRPTIKVGQPQSQTVYRQDLLYNDAEKVYTLNMDGRAEAYDIHGVSLTAALAWSVDGSEVGTGGNPTFKLILPDTEEPCDAVRHTVGVTVTDEEGNRAEVGIPITLKECEPEG
jgi:hypothetical protein